MRLALVGPVQLAPLRPWLQLSDDESARLPHGHGGTPVTQLAVGLLQRGYALTIVSLEPSIQAPAAFFGPQLRLRLGPYRPRHRARDAFRAERSYIRDALRQESPDMAHAHWSYEYALGALSSGCPTLVTVRDWAPTIFRLQPDPYRVVRLCMNIAVLAKGRRFTVTSPYMQQRLRRWLNKPVELVPNAVGDAIFTDATDASGGEGEGNVVIAVNNGFNRRKNVTALLMAFAQVRRCVPTSRLLLIGTDYESGGRAERWALSKGLASGVDFRGPVSHDSLPELLRSADVFVHPAIEESFGLVLVEAMAQRVPVIGGESSGAVPWVLGHGEAGILVDVTAPDELAEAMLNLFADPERRACLAAVGFRRAWDEFRVARVIDRYLESYRCLLAEQTA